MSIWKRSTSPDIAISLLVAHKTLKYCACQFQGAPLPPCICGMTVDTTPPEISLTVSPDTLWPPNHKMVLITPMITVSDNCNPDPIVNLQSITTNEGGETNTYDPLYDSTVGDGHTTDDIRVDANGDIYLRAERSGTGTGRIYTIIYTATDASGNSASAGATVTVPRNQ